jgi:hypothetical protein
MNMLDLLKELPGLGPGSSWAMEKAYIIERRKINTSIVPREPCIYMR